MDEVRKVFITGGGGFVAPHLIAALPRHWQLSVHMRKPATYTFDREVRLVHGAMDEADLTKEFGRGIDSVIHLAGAVQGPSNEAIIDSNVVTTRNVLAAMERCKVPSLVFMSTASVWSDNRGMRLNETIDANPSTLYGYVKLCAERLINASVCQGGIDSAVILRCNSTYGRGATQGVVHSFLQQISKSSPVVIYGDGQQLREPLYIDDLVDLIYRSLSLSGGLHLYGVSGPNALSVLKIAETIARATKNNLQIEWREDHPERVRHITIDTNKAKLQLGWSATTSFDEGICKTVGCQ